MAPKGLPRAPWEMDQLLSQIKKELEDAKNRLLTLDTRATLLLTIVGENRSAIGNLTDVELFSLKGDIKSLNEAAYQLESRLTSAEDQTAKQEKSIFTLDSSIPAFSIGSLSFAKKGEYRIPFKDVVGKTISMIKPSVSAELVGSAIQIPANLEQFSAKIQADAAAAWTKIGGEKIQDLGAKLKKATAIDIPAMYSKAVTDLKVAVSTISQDPFKAIISSFNNIPIIRFTQIPAAPKLGTTTVPQQLSYIGTALKSNIRSTVYGQVDNFVDRAVTDTWSDKTGVPDAWLRTRCKKFLKHAYKKMIALLEGAIETEVNKIGTYLTTIVTDIKGKVDSAVGEQAKTITSSIDDAFIKFRQDLVITGITNPIKNGLQSANTEFNKVTKDLFNFGKLDFEKVLSEQARLDMVAVRSGIDAFSANVNKVADAAMKGNFEESNKIMTDYMNNLVYKFNTSGETLTKKFNADMAKFVNESNKQMAAIFKQILAVVNMKVDATPGHGAQEGIVKSIGVDHFIVKIPHPGTVSHLAFGEPARKV